MPIHGSIWKSNIFKAWSKNPITCVLSSVAACFTTHLQLRKQGCACCCAPHASIARAKKPEGSGFMAADEEATKAMMLHTYAHHQLTVKAKVNHKVNQAVYPQKIKPLCWWHSKFLSLSSTHLQAPMQHTQPDITDITVSYADVKTPIKIRLRKVRGRYLILQTYNTLVYRAATL